jgi:hypothetical protein
MAELLDLFGDWTWWIIGGVLLIVELLLPGVFFIWLGLAALCVGAVDLFADLPWQGEVAIFAVLSVVMVLFGRPWLRKHHLVGTDQPTLNRRMYGYIGRTYFLDQAIENGRGKVRIDDTLWSVEGPDLPAGARVTVKEVRGLTLLVEKAEG